MTALVLIEVRAVMAEPRRGRRCPRAVKRKMSNFPSRSRAAPATNTRTRCDDAIRIVAPPPTAAKEPAAKEPAVAEADADPTANAASPPPPSPKKASLRRPDSASHVRDWKRSGLTRAEYCQRHGLKPTTFHHWVARSRNMFVKKARTAKATALTTRHWG